MKKTTKDLLQNSHYRGQDVNQVHPKYKSEMLPLAPTRSLCSVKHGICHSTSSFVGHTFWATKAVTTGSVTMLQLISVYIDAGVGNTNPVTLNFVTSGPSFPRNWKVKICQIPCNTIYRGKLNSNIVFLLWRKANAVFNPIIAIEKSLMLHPCL
jgi:hypothetical protein